MDNNEVKHSKPLIVVSNDDGFFYGGIQALAGLARQYGDVLQVAPTIHQSGKSSAITISTPLVLNELAHDHEPGYDAYGLTGTPADCAKVAIDDLAAGRKPALLLSGINHGYNYGNSTIYSGTMGVAFEGVLHGIPSVAFSYGNYSQDADFTPCMPWVKRIVEAVLSKGLPPQVCLNVNIPFCETPIKGIKVTKGACGHWINELERRVDPHGRTYYWMVGSYERDDPQDPATDLYWLDRGWVSVTPCHADQTDFASMPAISKLLGL